MKFFIPHADSEEQAEQVYSAVAKFIGSGVCKNKDRIYSIEYVHNGIDMKATVGKNIDSYYKEVAPLVIAIFEGNPLKICLENRGVVRGEPIFAGAHSIIKKSYFDE